MPSVSSQNTILSAPASSALIAPEDTDRISAALDVILTVSPPPPPEIVTVLIPVSGSYNTGDINTTSTGYKLTIKI